jgi:hypothetical protein
MRTRLTRGRERGEREEVTSVMLNAFLVMWGILNENAKVNVIYNILCVRVMREN